MVNDGRSLDPEDWERARALGHRMVDDLLTALATARDRPVWRPPSAAAREVFERPLAPEGRPIDEIYQDFKDHILPFGLGNTHPRFWGWVHSTGTVTGMLADMLASGMNGHVSFGDQSPIYVERQVLRWLVTLLGLPAGSTGLLVSSGSVATLTALTVARDALEPGTVSRGVRADGVSPVVYASDQVHNSVDKMVGVLGLGRDQLRQIPCRADFTCDTDAMAEAIARDRAQGLRPLCVVGTAGTVNTGAIDDLVALADLACREHLWFHVDAAVGAALSLSRVLRGRLRGIERADSIAFDLHKWFFLPYDVGCAIVCRPEAQHKSFSPPASYLAALDGGIPARGYPFGEMGLDLSRSFRALKVWMCLQEYGTERYGAVIERNVAQAAYLARMVRESPDLELLAPVPLNIVCFRHRPRGVTDPAAVDSHNRRIVIALHERGIAVPSYARIGGLFAIRVAVTNHRSRREDFDLLVDAVHAIGDELDSDVESA